MNMISKTALAGLLALGLSACGATAHDVNHKWCPPEAAPVAAPVAQTERIELSADALFQFDRSDARSLLPAGKAKLDELARNVQNGYVSVERIDLVGHTDRLGREAYNQELGLKRAQTVRDYLANRGIDSQMTVSSMGENQPVTTDCVGTKATAALKACLQPDRRVSIDITGVKKAQ